MKNIIIIGAGISGLTAGIYLKKSGFNVTIFEQHDKAGGMCASWKRAGYLIEGAVHWFTGSCPNTPLFQMWKETGALDENVKIHLKDPFMAAEWEGKTYCFYRSLEKTKEHLLSMAPEDAKMICKMVNDIKLLSLIKKPFSDIKGVKTNRPKNSFFSFKLIPSYLKALQLIYTSCGEYRERFKNPGIRWLISVTPKHLSALTLLYTLGTMSIGDGGYPEGGSYGIIDRMTNKFTSLGGNIKFKTKVKKVNIENGITKGVTLADEEVMNADSVIVAQETIAASEQLFDPPLRDSWLRNLKKNTNPTVTTFIAIGIRAEFPTAKIPYWKLDKPISYAGTAQESLGFFNYAGYSGYAPEGCSVITTILKEDTYDFWKKAKEEGNYEKEKQSLKDQVINELCKKFPQLNNKIDFIDIATPLTYERYTGAYHGSWMTGIRKGDMFKSYPGYSKYAKGLYFAGHRINPPGGLPLALDTGRKAAQMVCRQFGVLFR